MHFPWRDLTTALAIALLSSAASAQAVPPVAAAAAPAAAATPLDMFDAAWRVLRDNYVVEKESSVNLDAVRDELRPRAERATSEEEVRAIVREMLERVGQSHFALLAGAAAPAAAESAIAPERVGTLGFDIRLVDSSLVVTDVDPTGPAAKAGVRPGWALTRVGSRSVESGLLAIGDVPDHVKAFRAWALGTALLRGQAGESADLGFVDATGHAVSLQVARAPEHGQPIKFGHLPTLFARLDGRRVEHAGASIGVVRFNVWMTPLSRPFDEAMDRLRDARGIVIDLRGNPGGVLTMVMGFAGHFVDESVNLGTITTRDSSLKLMTNPRLVDVSGQPVRPFAGPVAILVDAGTYSASEIFSSGMQSIGRARVFGSQTAGGALPAVLERLPGGDVLQYAIGDFVTSTGQRVEGHGVMPDEVVTPTRDDLVAGRDPVLTAALDWIAKGSRPR